MRTCALVTAIMCMVPGCAAGPPEPALPEPAEPVPIAKPAAAPRSVDRTVFAIPAELSELADTKYPRLSELTADEIDALSARLRSLPIPARAVIYGFLQVGTPYQGGALGEEELPDSDPLVRFDVTDCTIFNLMNVSLAHSDSSSLRDRMLVAGYRGGEKSFQDRLHFTTDRLDESPYFRDVTSSMPSARKTKVRLNRKPDGSRWVDIDWERERNIYYVPSSAAKEVETPDVIGVAFVKRSFLEKGLDVLHEGMLYRGKLLVHASSRRGEVVVEPFEEFASRYDGVVFFEYR